MCGIWETLRAAHPTSISTNSKAIPDFARMTALRIECFLRQLDP